MVKRIYAEPDEQTMEEIGKAAEERGITRHKLILEAIDSYLHQSLPDVDSLRNERDSLRSERDSLKVEVDEKCFSDEIRGLEALEKKIRKEIDSVLAIAVRVKLVEPRTITRSEGKAKRVVDMRKI